MSSTANGVDPAGLDRKKEWSLVLPRRQSFCIHEHCGLRTAQESKEGAIMLVLSRHRDESIIIGDNIVITVVDVRGDKVRLGIDAPKEIPVHRQEVYEAIQRERQAEQQQRSSSEQGASSQSEKNGR